MTLVAGMSAVHFLYTDIQQAQNTRASDSIALDSTQGRELSTDETAPEQVAPAESTVLAEALEEYGYEETGTVLPYETEKKILVL